MAHLKPHPLASCTIPSSSRSARGHFAAGHDRPISSAGPSALVVTCCTRIAAPPARLRAPAAPCAAAAPPRARPRASSARCQPAASRRLSSSNERTAARGAAAGGRARRSAAALRRCGALLAGPLVPAAAAAAGKCHGAARARRAARCRAIFGPHRAALRRRGDGAGRVCAGGTVVRSPLRVRRAPAPQTRRLARARPARGRGAGRGRRCGPQGLGRPAAVCATRRASFGTALAARDGHARAAAAARGGAGGGWAGS